MKRKDPLVSIVMPVYNAEKFLSASRKSVLCQSYERIEVIAIDDHSTDSSFEILRKFRKQDKRLAVSKNKKRYGLGICLNRNITKAKGTLLAFMDPNDRMEKGRIAKQVTHLLSHPKVSVLGTQCDLVDQKNKSLYKSAFPTEHSPIYETILTSSSIQFETLMINCQLLPKDILYFTNTYVSFLPIKRYSLFAQVLLRLLPYGTFANLEEVLQHHRLMQSEAKNSKSTLEVLKLWVKSVAVYDYRPTFRSFFIPLVKGI